MSTQFFMVIKISIYSFLLMKYTPENYRMNESIEILSELDIGE